MDISVVEAEEDKLSHLPYNTAEGPVWRVRLLTKATDNTSRSQDQTFCHNYALLFGIHHALADGFSNISICKMLHTILEDVMAGAQWMKNNNLENTSMIHRFCDFMNKRLEN
ncbi:hypothetical protein Hamer_G026637 [Homarus americanus]|uniref:Condensation domain-containing protein n=1 Tax=Homarus americanus TaxID=6706 RepID=A0A8J5MRB0_HOMAM|nr:hypothetical protein Hamer_G026637 [Homarus americanus]